MKTQTIKIGTRGSQLALWQADWVKKSILQIYPDLQVELVIIKTKGDKILDVPLAKVGGKGLFVKEIEEALSDNRIDIAVHSMKDMPAELLHGLHIGAIPHREDPRDVMISKNAACLNNLRKNAIVGTSSLRRTSQLLHIRSDIEIIPLRGNVGTRLNKLDRGETDAVILASAGICRLGLKDRISEYFDINTIIPAVGQGALGIEIRQDDLYMQSIVSSFDHRETRIAVLSERAFLNTLEGGCQVPIAAHCIIENQQATLTGLVASLDGKEIIKDSISGPTEQAENIGHKLAESLLNKGAKLILDQLKSVN